MEEGSGVERNRKNIKDGPWWEEMKMKKCRKMARVGKEEEGEYRRMSMLGREEDE